MHDEADILLQIWREQRDQARQCEDQRALMTNIVLVLASAGIGLVVQHGFREDVTMLLVTVFLVLLGGYGAITSLKYRERYAYHNAQAKILFRRFDALYPALHLEEDKAEAIERHNKRKAYVKLYPWTPTGFVDTIRSGTMVYEERTGRGTGSQEVHPGI